MKHRTASAITCALLLMVASALPFIFLPVGSTLDTNKSHTEGIISGEAAIIEHKITSSELEEMKQKLGIWEERRNYNQKFNGHGTGLSPPTEEEWAEIAESAYVVDKILYVGEGSPPSSVDHTTGPWFPPIGDQDGEGSCTTWAMGYYTKTFQEAKEHGWNLTEAEWIGGYTGHPTPEYQNRTMSPDFIYHLSNEGVDHGSSYYETINLVCNIGASSWETMPYDPGDHSSWPPEEAWREAPLYRGNTTGLETMLLESDANLTSLKNWIASDHLALIHVDGDMLSTSNFPGMDILTLDNYPTHPSINHANTVVGYDDDFSYEEEGVWRNGAFKIANSWGRGGWEYTADGCYWISYEAMKSEPRFGYCFLYQDRIGYDPTLLASFNVEHINRSECDILVGVGNHSSPLATKSFSNWIQCGDYPFCANNVTLDVTELEDAVPSVYNQSLFMQVYDQAVLPPHSGTHYWYSDGDTWSWFRLGQSFDIPGGGATLNFWTYYEIEEYWDYGYVEVYDLNTTMWYTLPGLKTNSTTPVNQDNGNCPGQFEPWVYGIMGRWNGLTGFSDDMYEEEMDLTPFAGHTIDLYFTYWTDGYTLELGWYVDDIEIPEIGFFDDVESGSGNWTVSNLPVTADGWHIATPPPSPNGTVNLFSIEWYDSYSAASLKLESSSYDVPVNTTNLVYVYADVILTVAGDFDGDGDVDPDDFSVFAGAYGTSPPATPDCDLDRDGDVDPDDFAIFAANYGKSV